MDPQVGWSQLLHALESQEWPEVHEHTTNLIAWLDRGGFPPTVIQFEASIGTECNRVLVIAACELFLSQAAEHGWPP